jgi:preprotein translocase subunit SecY
MSSGLGRRIAITNGALLLFRLGTYTPVPGIDSAVWDSLFRQQAGGILGALDPLAGGAIARLSVLALSILPFLSAALLLQLASIVLPALRALPRSGEKGRRRLDVYTLVLTIILAAFQAAGIAFALESIGNIVAEPGMMFRVTTILTMTGGVVVLVWLAGLITARGIGNGIALILAVGIVAELPATLASVLDLVRRGVVSPELVLGVSLLAIALVGMVVHLELARRRIEVRFSGRRVGARAIEGRSYLRLKLNNAGIVPAILAAWLMPLPIMAVSAGLELPDWLVGQLVNGRPLFMVLYALAIVACVFFYTAFVLNPDDLAEDLRKHGGVIPGVAPGELTARHVDHVVSRVTAMGAGYLAFICLIPEIVLSRWPGLVYLGGTSLLIVVCAILDLKAQFDQARYDKARRKGVEAT